MAYINKALASELEKLLQPAEAAFARARSAERNAREAREGGGNPDVAFEDASTKDKMAALCDGSRRLALATAYSEAHGVVIGLRKLIDEPEVGYTSRTEADQILHRLWTNAVGLPGYVKDDWKRLQRHMEAQNPLAAADVSKLVQPSCVLCGLDVPVDELVTGQASGPKGVILHDNEVAHARCYEAAKARS